MLRITGILLLALLSPTQGNAQGRLGGQPLSPEDAWRKAYEEGRGENARSRQQEPAPPQAALPASDAPASGEASFAPLLGLVAFALVTAVFVSLIVVLARPRPGAG